MAFEQTLKSQLINVKSFVKSLVNQMSYKGEEKGKKNISEIGKKIRSIHSFWNCQEFFQILQLSCYI